MLYILTLLRQVVRYNVIECLIMSDTSPCSTKKETISAFMEDAGVNRL